MTRDLTGTTLGKYQIIERLGRGGMADVYRAFQPIMERYVAIKVMHTHLTEDEDFITRFKREAQIVGSLRHPHIVQVIDFDIHEGEYYMVMEYVQGDTLKAMLKRRGALQVKEALDIAAKLADALAYAHSKGMIHRDIKPANVLMDTKGSPILSDFGIARLGDLSGLTSTGLTVGTPSYMSPEAGRGEKVDERTDIYSLGIVLYEMLTGTVPYDADTPYAVILKHINDPLPMPRQFGATLPAFVEKVVLKALAKNREDRYQTAAEFRTAIDKSLEQLELEPLSSMTTTDVAATTVGTQIAKATTPVAPRRFSPLAGLVIVALLALIGGGAYLMSRSAPVATPTPTKAVVVLPSSTSTVNPTATPTATKIPDTATATVTVAPSATRTSAPTVESTATIEPTVEVAVASTSASGGKYDAALANIHTSIVYGDINGALRKIEPLIKDDPQSYDLIVARGWIYVESGASGMGKAFKDAQAAIKLDSDRPEAYALLGAYYQFGPQTNTSEGIVAANKKAIDYYNQAEQKGLNDYYLYWLRARANTTINGYIGSDNNVKDEVIKRDIEKAAAFNPTDYRFFIFRGDFYGGIEENDLALQSYEQALKLNPSPYIHLSIANIYIKIGQPEKALPYYKGQINEKHEANIDYIAQGAYVALRSNDLKTATDWADLALSLEPKAMAAMYIKGLIAFANGQYDEALKYFDQVAEADPNTYNYPFLNVNFGHHIQDDRGYTLKELGRKDEAIKAFSVVIEENPYWVDPLVERAKLYQDLNMIEEARADLKHAFELTSSDTDNARRDEILALLKALSAISPEPSPTP